MDARVESVDAYMHAVYPYQYRTSAFQSTSNDKPVRFISATSRMINAIGFDDLKQIENAPEYNNPESC
jgi:hypothetical protein